MSKIWLLAPDAQKRCCGCRPNPCDSCGCTFTSYFGSNLKFPYLSGKCLTTATEPSEFRCEMCDKLSDFTPSTGNLNLFTTGQNRNFTGTWDFPDGYLFNPIFGPTITMNSIVADGNLGNIGIITNPVLITDSYKYFGPPYPAPITYSLDFNYSIISNTGSLDVTGQLLHKKYTDYYCNAPKYDLLSAPTAQLFEGRFQSGEKIYITVDIALPKTCVDVFYPNYGIIQKCTDNPRGVIDLFFELPAATPITGNWISVNGSGYNANYKNRLVTFSTETFTTTTYTGQSATNAYCLANYSPSPTDTPLSTCFYSIDQCGAEYSLPPPFLSGISRCCRNSADSFYTPSYEIKQFTYEIDILKDNCIKFTLSPNQSYPTNETVPFIYQRPINTNIRLLDRTGQSINPLTRFETIWYNSTIYQVNCNQLP